MPCITGHGYRPCNVRTAGAGHYHPPAAITGGRTSRARSTTAKSLTLKHQTMAAVNGSNRIAPRYLRLPDINTLSCQNDLY